MRGKKRNVLHLDKSADHVVKNNHFSAVCKRIEASRKTSALAIENAVADLENGDEVLCIP